MDSETYVLHPGSATSTSDTYTHSWTFPSLTSQTLKLDISDPFSSSRVPGGTLPIRVSLTLVTGTSETSTQTHLAPNVESAKLMIHITSDVWRVLLEWPKTSVRTLLPSYSEVEAMVEALGRDVMGLVDEPGRLLDQVLGGAVHTLRGLWDWMRRGQGGLHTA
jgi:hypothetical protein